MRKNEQCYELFKLIADVFKAYTAIKVVVLQVLFILFVQASVQAATVARAVQSGVVTHVVDGDTLWVQIGSHDKPLKVRLQGIDAPEICQPGGAAAQAALKSRLMGQSVTVTSSAHDDYGRTVGVVHLQGQDMARWMVANGHAWVYGFRQKKGPYADDFAQAQTARRGLFSDTQAQEPRVFRKAHGSCYTDQKRHSSYKKSSGV